MSVLLCVIPSVSARNYNLSVESYELFMDSFYGVQSQLSATSWNLVSYGSAEVELSLICGM